MGTVAGFLIVVSPVLLVAFLIWRMVPGPRKEANTRRVEALEARSVVREIYEITSKYTGGLDPVGQAMYDEVNKRITDYWKDSK